MSKKELTREDMLRQEIKERVKELTQLTKNDFVLIGSYENEKTEVVIGESEFQVNILSDEEEIIYSKEKAGDSFTRYLMTNLLTRLSELALGVKLEPVIQIGEELVESEDSEEE